MPPAADKDEAVATFVLPLLLEPLAPLDELLLHPAAKTRLPAAAVAAIAYLPRKIFLPCPGHMAAESHRLWLDRSTSWLDKLSGR
jgi:hypothetical protein